MSQFTDMFDNPISEGSLVTYTTLGGRSAFQNFAVVEDFVELIEKPSGGTWHSTGPNSRIPYIRTDQQKNSRPTEFYVEKDPKGRPRQDKLAVARVREVRDLGGGRFEYYAKPRRLGTRRLSELLVIDSLAKGVRDPD